MSGTKRTCCKVFFAAGLFCMKAVFSLVYGSSRSSASFLQRQMAQEQVHGIEFGGCRLCASRHKQAQRAAQRMACGLVQRAVFLEHGCRCFEPTFLEIGERTGIGTGKNIKQRIGEGHALLRTQGENERTDRLVNQLAALGQIGQMLKPFPRAPATRSRRAATGRSACCARPHSVPHAPAACRRQTIPAEWS